MNKYLFLILGISIITTNCTNKQNDVLSKQPFLNTKKAKTLKDLSLFTNTTGHIFCIYLPLKEFKLDEESIFKSYEDNVEMIFLPTKKTDTEEKITLNCFKNDYHNSLVTFYENDIAILKNTAFSIEKNIITPDYYKIEGFHPELSEYKFVSIVWVKNNIYRFDLVYPKNDSTKWTNRMETIEEEGMQCN